MLKVKNTSQRLGCKEDRQGQKLVLYVKPYNDRLNTELSARVPCPTQTQEETPAGRKDFNIGTMKIPIV